MYGYICSHCGAHLDPGEKCDCGEIRRAEEEKRLRIKKDMETMLLEEESGQFRLAV